MYERMISWENDSTLAKQSLNSTKFAQIWQAAQKVVFSRSLESVATKRTRLERIPRSSGRSRPMRITTSTSRAPSSRPRHGTPA